jgi:NADPH:quinone reductase-like Zn-dependent oxidoreductase
VDNLRLGVSEGVSFPRVPGIEAAGIVDAAPADSGLAPGQKVVAMIGDMGRHGVNAALDLVGTPTLPDTLRAVRVQILDAVAAGQLTFPVDHVYNGLEQVRQAHDDMEHNRTGKLVVRIRHQDV